MPRQNSFLDIAIATEALHRLVQKSGRTLAGPVFDRRRQKPHVSGLVGVNACAIESPAEPHDERDGGFHMQRHVRKHRAHQWLIGKMLLEYAAVPGMMKRIDRK